MCRQTQNQLPGAMVGAPTETLHFLLLWEHVGGDQASSISDLQILFSSCFCPSSRKPANFSLSWGLCKPSEA